MYLPRNGHTAQHMKQKKQHVGEMHIWQKERKNVTIWVKSL